MEPAETLCPSEKVFLLSITLLPFRSQQSLLCIPITLFKISKLYSSALFYQYTKINFIIILCTYLTYSNENSFMRGESFHPYTVDSQYFLIKYKFYVWVKLLFFPSFLFKLELYITSSSKSIVMKQEDVHISSFRILAASRFMKKRSIINIPLLRGEILEK